jgi:hypothetical protein
MVEKDFDFFHQRTCKLIDSKDFPNENCLENILVFRCVNPSDHLSATNSAVFILLDEARIFFQQYRPLVRGERVEKE